MFTAFSNTETSVNSCLSILKRSSFKESEKTVSDLMELLAPDETAIKELERENPYVSVSLKHHLDPYDPYKRSVGKSYRSPWTNKFDPPLSSTSSDEEHDATHGLSDSLRTLEIQYNEIFASYCSAYYGKGAISSVYLGLGWNSMTHDHSINDTSTWPSQGFSACFAVKKWVETEDDNSVVGIWNGLHVVNIGEFSGGSASYKMKTTVFLSLMNDSSGLTNSEVPPGKINNTGKAAFKTAMDATLTRQVERTLKVNDGNHLANIGKMIEDTENDIRSSMESIYIPKTKEIAESLHPTHDETSPKSAKHRERKQQVSMELNEEMLARIMKRSITSPL